MRLFEISKKSKNVINLNSHVSLFLRSIGELSLCGHSRGAVRDDIQSVARDPGQLDVRATGLRPVQQLRRALLDGQHHAPVLHLGGSVSK